MLAKIGYATFHRSWLTGCCVALTKSPHKPDRTAPPRDVRGLLCAGLYSSASTWMLNLAAQILKIGGRAGVKTIYLDEMDEAAERAIRGVPFILAKSHSPGASVRSLIDGAGLPVIITLRDPRDAVASLMLRWNIGFDLALSRVGRSATALVMLADRRTTLRFHYEDGFTTDERCVDAVAKLLGVTLTAEDRAALLAGLAPQAVRQQIDSWRLAGVLGHGPPDMEYEPETHWHLGHIGDGETGKWRRVLGAIQAGRVLLATRAYRKSFGYSRW
jgi:hypothetical protein